MPVDKYLKNETRKFFTVGSECIGIASKIETMFSLDPSCISVLKMEQTNEMSTLQQLRDSKIMTQRVVLGFTLEAIAAFHGMTQADVRTVLVAGVADLKAQGMTQENILASVAKDDAELIASLSRGAAGNDPVGLQNQMLRAEVDSLRARVTHLETMVSQLMQHQAAASVPPPPPLRPQNQFFSPNPLPQRNWSQGTTTSSLHPEENWNANWWQTRS